MRHLLTAVLLGVAAVVFLLSLCFVAYTIQEMLMIAKPDPFPSIPRLAILPFLLLLGVWSCLIKSIK